MPISIKTEAARIRKALRDPPVPPLSSIECIRLALKNHPGKTVVSWSGGKCSTVVLYLTLKEDPNIPVVWNNTGVHFPETIKFVKTITKLWKLNLHVLHPIRSFWSCVKEYGFPMLRGQYKNSSKSKDGKPMCCQFLKEMPFQQFFKDTGYEATLTGLRASESRVRMFGIANFGQYYYAKTLKHFRYHPIAFWGQSKLDRFHVENELPQNPVYFMGQERCGCWCCTGYITWQKSLRKSHPKMYRFLSKKIGQPTLWEYVDDCISFLEGEGLI